MHNRILGLRASKIIMGHDKNDMKTSSAINFGDRSKQGVEMNFHQPKNDISNLKFSEIMKSDFEE